MALGQFILEILLCNSGISRIERGHVDQIALRITQLQGEPNFDPEGLATRSSQAGIRVEQSTRRASRVHKPHSMVPWCSLECTPACQAGGRGFKSRRDRTTEHGRVAQLAERPPEKRKVTGSTPVPTTTHPPTARSEAQPRSGPCPLRGGLFSAVVGGDVFGVAAGEVVPELLAVGGGAIGAGHVGHAGLGLGNAGHEAGAVVVGAGGHGGGESLI